MDALREAAELLEARRRTSEEEASEREEPPEVEQETHERHLARLVTCARAPLRFAREEAHEARERDAALVSVSSSQLSSADGRRVALGAWLASAEAPPSRRVFADTAPSTTSGDGLRRRARGRGGGGRLGARRGRRRVSDQPIGAFQAGQRKTSRRSKKRLCPRRRRARAFSRRRADGDCPFLARAPARALRTRSGARASRRARRDGGAPGRRRRARRLRACTWRRRASRRAPTFAGGRPRRRRRSRPSRTRIAGRFWRNPDPRSERDGSASEEVLRTSRLAQRLAAASGRLVSALASETGGENGQKLNESKAERTRSPLTPSEIAGWRAGLSVARAFAGDPDDSVVLAYLENAACAVVETAARTTRAAAKKALETNSRIALDSADAERAFAADAAAALLAFAVRRFPPNASNSNEAAAVVAVSAPSTRAPRGSRRAPRATRSDVAVAAAEASAELEKNARPRPYG